MSRYDSLAELTPYSRRHSGDFGAAFEPWSIEMQVEAQRRECAGATHDEIADAMGLSVADVRRHLRSADMGAPSRPQRAALGYSYLKGR